MLTLTQRCAAPGGSAIPLQQTTQRETQQAPLRLELPFEIRQRSRFRAQLPDGRDVGVILERGQILRDGDHLCSEHGHIVHIVAAPEPVSEAWATDPLVLQRACYHLGNRHVALQIGSGWLRYGHDHVLDAMVRGLGLEVEFKQAAFEPEPGAYGGHSQSHSQSHSHSHDHAHGHSHDHDQSHDHDRAHHPEYRRYSDPGHHHPHVQLGDSAQSAAAPVAEKTQAATINRPPSA